MELIVQSLEMSQKRKVAPSFKKRMRLLMQYGLVKGIIPISMQKKSNQLTLDTVLKEPDGNSVE